MSASSSSSSSDDNEVDNVEMEAIAPSLLDAVLSRLYDCGDKPTWSAHSKDAAKKKQREAPTDTRGSDSKPAAETQVQVGEHSKLSKRKLKVGGTTHGKGLRKGGRELPSHLRDLHQAALEEPQSSLHHDGESALGGEENGPDAKDGAGGKNEISGEGNRTGPGGSQVNTRGKAIQVVVYEDSRKRKRPKENPQVAKGPKPSMEVTKLPTSEQETGFSIEKARLEVHKFGLTGYSRERQRECERARAIRLGAKAPKPEYINYKELLSKKRQQKEDAEKKQLEEAEAGIFNKKKKGKRHVESRRGRHDDPGVEGMPGRFRGGALLLSKEDIRRIKTSRS